MNNNVIAILLIVAILGSAFYVFLYDREVDDSVLDLEENSLGLPFEESDIDMPINLDSLRDTTSQPQQQTPPRTGPAMVIEEGVEYQAYLKTSEGMMTVNLFADQVPVTVNNFVSLSNAGFYSGVRFHRIMKGFMIQSGDPFSKDLSLRARWGTGDAGYKFNDEPFTGEYLRGTIAMANSGPNTNGSQFFIMHEDYPLPPSYTIFGRISAEDAVSLETLDKIATSEVTRSASGEMSSPVDPVVIETITIIGR